MRKYQRAAVVVAMLGSVSFLGAGIGNAADGGEKYKFDNKQNQSCDMNYSGKTLVGAGDIGVNVGAVLGWGDMDQSEKESQSCGQDFKVGGKKH
ncbi:hypothetical protein CLM62_03480 [Streptomyces sp. SA15]|uniref:hypothetical protein n=1 Tax=Streptomyces sp. SA15 TaxID=934019 RepID=UPI000BB01E2A|nr:hypothetical protein [Streptomyces sp. SA15]PAZ17244.1 hypothetical protein CLM62_03480 [Streptomyces sp. SA15]